MNDSPTPSSSPNLPAVLGEIVEHKRAEIEAAKARCPIGELESMIRDTPPTRDFFGVLTSNDPNAPRTRVIAEIKRASPSAGLIRPEYAQDGFRPEVIAEQYSKHGASAISCLTDEKFFGGELSFIERIKGATPLAVLRKDFILDEYQLSEARAHGADAVLLIAECLDDTQIARMLDLNDALGLSTLLEVHSRPNLERILPLLSQSANKRVLLGINNRDLTRMVTDLRHTTDLVDLVADRSILVSESGIKTPADLEQLRAHRVYIALVGEHLMRQPNPGKALETMLATQIGPLNTQ